MDEGLSDELLAELKEVGDEALQHIIDDAFDDPEVLPVVLLGKVEDWVVVVNAYAHAHATGCPNCGAVLAAFLRRSVEAIASYLAANVTEDGE